MTPDRWEKIKDLLATALDVASADRATFLDQHCAGDDLLRRDVELLLRREHVADSQFLGEESFAAVAAAVLPEEDNPWIGRRVGAYQIVEQIGTGGMGEVYRAFRADDQYRKEVALKVIRAGQDSGSVVTRFKNERQILAGLEHPNIARLLDGGTTEEGTPYLVMEMIEGQPIGEYCDARELSIPERLKLFIDVCAAVHYAHQRLIIHRDIKPGNILVTADGTPKLLDFGIAKVLGLDFLSQGNETLTAFRVLTPGYASPEQIMGEPMTTASDVYSLGVVLYELLTGRSPYGATSRTSHDLTSAICERESEKPSASVSRVPLPGNGVPRISIEQAAAARGSSPARLQKQLSGDLDNIVLMALRKEPSRRYTSAEQFAADVRRHLDSIPVLAHKDTPNYRISKFVRRHKASVAGSLVAILAILAGLTFALYEARAARQQAEIARAQRARAERRFNDVRKLANSLMFEIHDSIRDLPGAVSARKLLVNRALEYLDSLSQEASADVSLQRELAAAYDRVGDLLGYTGAADLGDYAGALQSYKKALAIRESLAATKPDDASIQSDLLNDYFQLSFVLLDAGDYPGALDDSRKGLSLASKCAATQADPNYKEFLSGFYWRTGAIQNQTGNYVHAAESFRQAISIGESVALVDPRFRRRLPASYIGLAAALGNTSDVNRALQAGEKGLQDLEQYAHSNPTNATLREYLGEAYNMVAPLHEKKGNLDRALAYYRDANRIFADLKKADPANSLARANFGFSTLGITQELLLKHEIQPAMAQVRQAIATFEGIEPKNRYDRQGQAESYSTFGMAYEALADHESSPPKKAADLREARLWLQKGLRTLELSSHESPPDAATTHDTDQARTELAKCESALAKLSQ